MIREGAVQGDGPFPAGRDRGSLRAGNEDHMGGPERYFRGSANRPSTALAATVAGLPRKMRASREPMRPW